jgi:hypothetical protein
MRRLVLLGCFSVLAAGQADFRKASWGMTQAQVLATEANKPSEIRQSDGELIVRYDSIQLSGLPGRAVYIFAKDKLVRAKYLFDVEHDEENDFIVDFKTIELVLMEQYGEPASSRAFGESDLCQQEPKSYLDQDRAAPSEILLSDRFVGLAVALGQLKLYTQWAASRTKILHGLTGQDHHITHQIEYLSVELEGLENETRGSAQ